MNHNNTIKVGISVGDINGIGLEVILKTFDDKRMLELCTPIIYASKKLVTSYKNKLHFHTPIHSVFNVEDVLSNKLNILNVWKEDVEIAFGESKKESGKYARLSLESAVKDLKENKIDVLVTAPINKNTIHSDSFPFPGHTEFLEDQLGGEALMILMTDEIKVALLTSHIPLSQVAITITPDLIHNKVNILSETLKKDFNISSPKIAVLSINPHAGDSGLIGTEDDTVLKPTIAAIQASGKLVYGPFAADGFFGSRAYLDYDAVLASYHDQGLTAFKTLSFGKGVNFTAGLSRIRTSPDHGTAFQIAGKRIAEQTSFREAVYKAIDIYRTRKENEMLVENAL